MHTLINTLVIFTSIYNINVRVGVISKTLLQLLRNSPTLKLIVYIHQSINQVLNVLIGRRLRCSNVNALSGLVYELT